MNSNYKKNIIGQVILTAGYIFIGLNLILFLCSLSDSSSFGISKMLDLSPIGYLVTCFPGFILCGIGELIEQQNKNNYLLNTQLELNNTNIHNDKSN